MFTNTIVVITIKGGNIKFMLLDWQYFHKISSWLVGSVPNLIFLYKIIIMKTKTEFIFYNALMCDIFTHASET